MHFVIPFRRHIVMTHQYWKCNEIFAPHKLGINACMGYVDNELIKNLQKITLSIKSYKN
jgi:hypothetical protein